MSRNLGRTDCYYCHAEVVLVEPPRVGTVDDFGRYEEPFRGMEVANAVCLDCGAKYLAWVRENQQKHTAYRDRTPEDGNGVFFDLSFRHSFNDEPAPEDLPEWHYETIEIRVRRPASRCTACGGKTAPGGGYCGCSNRDRQAFYSDPLYDKLKEDESPAGRLVLADYLLANGMVKGG